MNHLASEILRLMRLRSIGQTLLARLTGNKIKQPQVNYILEGIIPAKPETVDLLAEVLGGDKKLLRTLAVTDLVQKQARTWGVAASDVCGFSGGGSGVVIVPLFSAAELKDALDKKGYPKRKKTIGRWIKVPAEYGLYNYGIEIADHSLQPKAAPGDVAVVSQEAPVGREGYGVIGAKGRVLVGRIRDYKKMYVVETITPYQSEAFVKKDVQFIAKIVAVLDRIETSNPFMLSEAPPDSSSPQVKSRGRKGTKQT